MRRGEPIRRRIGIGWLIVLASGLPSLADQPPRLTIVGAGRISSETPVLLECSRTIETGTYELRDGSRTMAATVFEDAGKTYLAMVLARGAYPDSETFDLGREAAQGVPVSGVALIGEGRRVAIQVEGKLVTTYIPDDGPKPYLYPLLGPSGASMTRAFPMKNVAGEKTDHPHHRSFWFTHGSVNKVDFWSEMPGHGRIVETSRPTIVSGKSVGRLRTTDDWLALDGKKVCEDERVLTVYATEKVRILDFDVTLKASVGPVTFGDTKEGMFGLRLATSMDVTSRMGGKITNAEAITDKEAWGKASPWVDYVGPVDGRSVGVALLNHPASFRYPTTWHVRDYGLFAANPFGYRDFGRKASGEFVLPAGESIQFRYRIFLHDGDTTEADIPGAFRDYEAPPKVSLTP